jgi:hypothetical protein
MSTSSIQDWVEDVELARKKGTLQKPRANKMPGKERVRGKRAGKPPSTATRRSQRILNLAPSSVTPRTPRHRRPQQLLAPPVSRGGRPSAMTGVMPTHTATPSQHLISADICEVSPLELDTLPDDVHELVMAVQGIRFFNTPTVPAAVIVRLFRLALRCVFGCVVSFCCLTGS